MNPLRVTVTKIGSGSAEPDKPPNLWEKNEGPYRPETEAHSWRVVEERDTEFVIEIIPTNEVR